MSLFDDASLVMIPSGYKEDVVYSVKPTDGSGDLTFTRASDGTRVNSDGLIERVPWNLVQYSEQFDNGVWGKYLTTVTANTTTAPNGTLTADSLIENTASGLHQVAQTSASTGGVYTVTIYAKANGRNWFLLNIAAASQYGAWFDIQNGVVGTVESNITSTTIENVGNGWYRCSVTGNTGAINPRLSLTIATGNNNISYTGDGTSGLYLFGGQINEGSTAKPYFPTTNRKDVPRLTYEGGCPSLLLEPQRTNLAIYSEQLDLWNGFNASVTANTSVSPYGYQNADNVSITATNGYWRRANLTFSNSTSYVASVFVKKSETTGTKLFNFYYNNNMGSPNNGIWNCTIDLTNITATTSNGGTAVTGAPTILSTNIVEYGNEWYRVEVAFTVGSSAGNSYSEIGFQASGVVVDFLAWGAQLEAGSYATSYIPTLGTTVTRIEDGQKVENIADLIGQTEGTIFMDINFRVVTDGGIRNFFSLEGSVSNQFNGLGANTGNNANNVQYAGTPYTLSEGRHKIVCTYSESNNERKLYVDGALRSTSTHTNFSTTINKLSVGCRINPFSSFNTDRPLVSGVNQFALYPILLSNDDCLSLSTL